MSCPANFAAVASTSNSDIPVLLLSRLVLYWSNFEPKLAISVPNAMTAVVTATKGISFKAVLNTFVATVATVIPAAA
jgi:hypothetical protein